MSIRNKIVGWYLSKEIKKYMAKDNAILKYLNGKKMYIGTALFFLAQGLRALNPVILKPLAGFEIPDSALKVLEYIVIGLGSWGATHKLIKESK